MAKPEKPAPAKPGKPVKPEPVEAEVASAKPNSKKLVLGIIGVLVVLGVIGGIYYFTSSKGGDHTKEAKASAPLAPPKFIKLDTFTVNLHHEPGEEERVLQTAISLEIQDTEHDKLEEKIKLYMPKIYNNLLILLSRKSAAELTTSSGGGKQQLAKEIKEEVEVVLGLRTAAPSKPIVHAGSEHNAASGVIAASEVAASGVIAASGAKAQPEAEASPDAEATSPDVHAEAVPEKVRASVVSVLFTSFIIQ